MTASDRATSAPAELAAADPAHFLSFGAFCKGLANVKPRLSMSRLDQYYYDALAQHGPFADKTRDSDPERILVGFEPDVFVTLKELDELHHHNHYGSRVISPAGAKLLIRLYWAGVLDTGRTKPSAVSVEAQAYADSEQALREAATLTRTACLAYNVRLKDLASFSESEFTFTLLNDIFFANHGPGETTLAVGGIAVSKSLLRYSSNSGKSHDYAVCYSWTGADGVVRTATKDSVYAGNRRNDPDRNWGLPE